MDMIVQNSKKLRYKSPKDVNERLPAPKTIQEASEDGY